MAAVDKIYGTLDQLYEFRIWLEKHKPEYLVYVNDPTNFPKDFKKTIVISNFPMSADAWLYTNCPLDFIRKSLEFQYNGVPSEAMSIEEISKRHEYYDGLPDCLTEVRAGRTPPSGCSIQTSEAHKDRGELLKKVEELEAQLKRSQDLHKRNSEEYPRNEAYGHHCDYRVKFEAVVERSKAALKGESDEDVI